MATVVNGYEAEPSEVAAVLGIVELGEVGEDLNVRYILAAKALALHTAVVDEISRARDAVVMEAYEEPGQSYATVGDRFGLSRARVQQIVERGRARQE